MSETYEDICTFCCEVHGSQESNLFYELGLATSRREYLLMESSHFVVMPCIGALTDWYVLVVSKRHALSVGWLHEGERDELRGLLADVSRVLQARTDQNVIIFEHGSYDFRDKGGACYDHAHVHVVATRQDAGAFLNQLPPTVQLTQTTDWTSEARRVITTQRRAYLAVQGEEGNWFGAADGAPSQFFRRCLARWLGAEDGEWDWLTYPQRERVGAMMRQGLSDTWV